MVEDQRTRKGRNQRSKSVSGSQRGTRDLAELFTTMIESESICESGGQRRPDLRRGNRPGCTNGAGQQNLGTVQKSCRHILPPKIGAKRILKVGHEAGMPRREPSLAMVQVSWW